MFQPSVQRFSKYVLRIAFKDNRSVELVINYGNPTDVTPEKADARTMRIGLPVGILMMPTMDRYPARG